MTRVSLLATWRTLALGLALANLKSVPLAWTLRIFYRMFANWSSKAQVAARLKEHVTSNKIHPLFQPVSIFTRAPLLEIDYNLHKSNSTYFSDLDESRAALVTKLLVAGFKQGGKNLEREGHRGRLSVILGSVHTSFHREIKPYERYEVRSRILGWDKKWLVIVSFFVRPATKGKEEVLLASALSKYVVKKGRFSVPPEQCLNTAGWLPERPEDGKLVGTPQSRESWEGSAVLLPGGTSDPSQASSLATPDGIAAPIPETAAEVTAAVVERFQSATAEAASSSNDTTDTECNNNSNNGGWDWHRIELERLRGIEIARNWLDLDKELTDEFKRN